MGPMNTFLPQIPPVDTRKMQLLQTLQQLAASKKQAPQLPQQASTPPPPAVQPSMDPSVAAALQKENAIYARHPTMAAAYNDPEWIAARKATLAAKNAAKDTKNVASAQASAKSIPPHAASRLQEGHITTFANGQKWTLQGGKPTPVEDDQELSNEGATAGVEEE